ncbi:MAG: sodium-dependent transporter [Porticoccaceae bacterium]
MSESSGPVQGTVHGVWRSRWVFILAATGSAVGLGNIWKFPYIAGENGGGAFVLVYLACILFVAIPIMMAEVMLGRLGRMSPVNAMKKVVKATGAPRLWGSIGWLGVAAGVLILSYYAVIGGWVLHYVVEMGSGRLQGASAGDVAASFSSLLENPQKLIFWQTLFMVLTMGVVIGGVTKGLGVAVKVMMPLLFVLLFVLLIFAAQHGDWAAGARFLFSFRSDSLTWSGVMEALGHSFFTLSLGMGAIMAYGAYMPEGAPIGRTVLTIAGLDTLVSLAAGMAIFPIVFASPGMAPNAGPSLMFQTLPVIFANMPGGLFFGTLFFVLVTIAAWSSSISLIEPAVAWLIETWRVSRATANLVIGTFAWVLGLGTVFSFNLWKDHTLAGNTFFEVMDFATASILLPLVGLLISAFVGWAMKREDAMAALGDNAVRVLKVWHWLLAYVATSAIALILVVGLYKKFF